MNEPEIHWNDSLEQLVKKEAERSLALRWAHDESQRWCATCNTYLFFPCVILSTLSGVGSVGAQNLLPFDGNQTFIGLVSLVVAILQTTQNYFAFAKRSESHRIASLQYGKIHAELSLQLSLPKKERKKASDLIEYLKDETDRLSEIAPQIPAAIKVKFHEKFADIKSAVPTILNGLEEVEITTDIVCTPKPMLRITL